MSNFYEQKAEEFLRLKGYRIMQKNFRTRLGEIDIIAGKKDGVSFVEVKGRKNNAFLKGYEAIDRRKRDRIRKSAQLFSAQNPPQKYQFDVLEITQGRLWRQYQLFEEAFTLDET